jgi:hypothetical protein
MACPRSVLGSVLFLLLYVNDLPLNDTGSKIVLFADDTNILVSLDPSSG